MNTVMGAPSLVEVECAWRKCGLLFRARRADRARGWARFCSKSCKASAQTDRTHVGREARSR